MPLASPRTSSPRPTQRTLGEPVPFEYAAVLRLTGEPGNIVEEVIHVGADGVFVATGVSYALEDQRREPLRLSIPPDVAGGQHADPRRVILDHIPASAWLRGVRVRPERVSLLFEPDRDGQFPPDAPLVQTPIPVVALNEAFEIVQEPSDYEFLVSFVDSATGRELQDQPVHNLASLGRTDGRRPFRSFAAPMSFEPRTTLRVQIVERTPGIRGLLTIVLQGYLRPTGPCAAGPMSAPSMPGALPFDYVARFSLTGNSGLRHEQEIPVATDGAFAATAIGYGLVPAERDVVVLGSPQSPGPFNLAAAHLGLALFAFDNLPLSVPGIRLGQLPPSALRDGLRIRPGMIRNALSQPGKLASLVGSEYIDHIFERLNRPELVRFRYSIFDTGRGRELSNRPIDSLAGLGSGDGVRPFKPLRTPLVLPGRSSLRIAIEEVRGRGELYIAFQGFKHLVPRGRSA